MANSSPVSDLERTRDATLPYFSAEPDALSRSYAPGKWSMRHILLHLTDCETVYFERLRCAIADEKAVLAGFDPDGWSKRLLYDRRSLALAASLYSATRESLIEIARNAPPEVLERDATHAVAGRRSIGTSHDHGLLA